MASATYLVPILASMAFGALSGATQPNPNPNSFGSLDAIGNLHDFRRRLDDAYNGINEFTSRDVSLPDATVQNLPTFDGPDLPMPIGVGTQPSQIGLNKPFTLPGINFGPHSSSPAGVGTPGVPAGHGGGDYSPNPVPDVPGPGRDDGDTTGGGGGNTRLSTPGAQRQMFMPSPTNAPYSTLGQGKNDPTHAALSLLYHAAGM